MSIDQLKVGNPIWLWSMEDWWPKVFSQPRIAVWSVIIDNHLGYGVLPLVVIPAHQVHTLSVSTMFVHCPYPQLPSNTSHCDIGNISLLHCVSQYCTLIKSHLTTWIETQVGITPGTCLQNSPVLILLVSTVSVREVAGGGEMSHSHSSLTYQPEMRGHFRRNQDMSTQLEI